MELLYCLEEIGNWKDCKGISPKFSSVYGLKYQVVTLYFFIAVVYHPPEPQYDAYDPIGLFDKQIQ